MFIIEHEQDLGAYKRILDDMLAIWKKQNHLLANEFISDVIEF
ncbi:hypothetical protein M493_01300 [Geobacillus genomosp. 3]|uniref:Uncharacterized protein n=1 Tax=Geobacillus genomosp. 3 TaxID=1921421 RepID=S5Z0Y2_GEOG3|nr:hypothetical protein M493_01300 [Geobacillus genomosp. 3]